MASHVEQCKTHFGDQWKRMNKTEKMKAIQRHIESPGDFSSASTQQPSSVRSPPTYGRSAERNPLQQQPQQQQQEYAYNASGGGSAPTSSLGYGAQQQQQQASTPSSRLGVQPQSHQVSSRFGEKMEQSRSQPQQSRRGGGGTGAPQRRLSQQQFAEAAVEGIGRVESADLARWKERTGGSSLKGQDLVSEGLKTLDKLDNHRVQRHDLSIAAMRRMAMTQEQYTEQLQARDREHETTLIGISEEISDYIAHMKEELHGLQVRYVEELARLESGFVKDRERLLTGNRSEIRKMIERRHLCEVQFLKEKIDMTDAYRQTCASGHDRDIIAHNELMATLDEIIPSR